MAITPTGDIFKGFEFDGLSSKNYGIYITGNAVYNAPERDVEMITIPGRNGTFALDQGRFENIEVTYPAGIFADNELDFAEAISDFRNYLCSRNGYCRLTDEYNPTEYRMAVYKSGLEVTPAQLKAGQFNITFDCKPQRFLMSGEAVVSVASGATLLNPTMFEASPLLEAKGHGTIGFNGYEIELIPATFGTITLNAGSRLVLTPTSFSFNPAYGANGDELYFLGQGHEISFSCSQITYQAGMTLTYQNSNPDAIGNTTLNFLYDDVQFPFGTPKTITNTLSVIGTKDGVTETAYWTGTIEYDGQGTVTFSSSKTWSEHIKINGNISVEWNPFYIDSSKQILGDPTYIDCDYGEAYKIEGGSPVSINQQVDLGSDLPKLAAGTNVISFDNTITDLKITPRWWKL